MHLDQGVVPESGDGARWYVVQAQPRREALAVRHLENQEFEAFCPLYRSSKRIGRHNKICLQPLFPGYVFVRFDLERDRWRSINGTIGVLRLVAFGQRGHEWPAPLPAGFIERLRELGAENGEIRFRDKLPKGASVRIIGGPFDQLCGVLESAADQERVTILLDVLTKGTRVNVSRDLLIAA